MSFRNYPGSEGPNDSDLPEFDPDVLDAFPRAIAAIRQSEILNKILENAMEQEDFVINPDDIPLDSELISAYSKLYPKLTPEQLRQNICHTLKLSFLEFKGKLSEIRYRRRELDQLALQNERLERELKRDDLYFRFLQISSIALVLSVTIVFALCGVLLFHKIQNPTYASDRQVQQELSDFKQRLEQRQYQQELSDFRKHLEQKK